MCGIYAVLGSQQAANQVLAGLKRLEYRGYDSWGIATVTNGKLQVKKQTGKIGQVEQIGWPSAEVAIGHTRWATHGGITHQNAHPHLASDGSFALAQNGIVQNFDQLKKSLKKQGFTFISQTDTEVIVRLIEQEKKTTKDLETAVVKAFKKLEGRNTIILLTVEGQIIAVRNGSPLVIGLNKAESQIYFSSDVLSLADQVSKVVMIDDQQMVATKKDKLEIRSVVTGKIIPVKKEPRQALFQDVGKEGFDHYMLKEIHESPLVIGQILSQPSKNLQKTARVITQADQVYTIGSGTAGVAASQIAYYLRKFGHISARGLVGADAVEYLPLITKNDVVIAPSQSGETADVLEILEQLKHKRVPIVTYVNMQGASMTRLSDYPFLAQAGPEISVMSTKIFISQIAWGYLLAKTVQGQAEMGRLQLQQTAEAMATMLAEKNFTKKLKKLANWLKPKPDVFLLAKGQNFQIIREGMIKLIEGSYKHAHAIPAGDLKHYAITLMEKGIPVIAVLTNDEVFSDVMNAAHEVKARGASIVGVGPKSDSFFDHFIMVPDLGETSAMISVLPLQLLAYYLAVSLGHDVDHPRNIAKSVTVK